MDKVSDDRRKGDRDKKYAIIAEMSKLTDNSAFAITAMNKNKFSKTLKENIISANQYNELFEIIGK
jgi:hypothetical protein